MCRNSCLVSPSSGIMSSYVPHFLYPLCGLSLLLIAPGNLLAGYYLKPSLKHHSQQIICYLHWVSAMSVEMLCSSFTFSSHKHSHGKLGIAQIQSRDGVDPGFDTIQETCIVSIKITRITRKGQLPTSMHTLS